MAQLQHNMWVTSSRSAVLSIITGGGKWVEMTIPSRSAVPAPFADRGEEVLALCSGWRDPSPVWRRAAAAQGRGGTCGRHEHVQMPGRNLPACSGRPGKAALAHERSKGELKALVPEDAKEAAGHGVRAKRSKSGAISLDLAS
jgi:hypothetical protein